MFLEKPIMSVLLQITFLCLFLIAPILSLGSFNSACIPSKREALLQFKHGLSDPSNRIQSWEAQTDCCQWYGVICNNLTGHVMELHLQSLSFQDYAQEYGSYEGYMKSIFGGKISSCLLNLKELRYFDLSNNDFGRIQIPKFLGSLGSLRVLNLSSAGFGGRIPHELGNLSNLQYLNLHYNYDAYADSLHWLLGLSLLEYLDMSYVNLTQPFHWLKITNELPSLVELHLSGSNLVHIPALVHVNFSSISVLDLSGNYFPESLIPNWVFRLKTLKFLNLVDNHFEGPVHTHLQNMTSLQRLDLSSNQFSLVPKWVLRLRTLLSLNLGWNNFDGPIPNELQIFSSIKELHLFKNGFYSSIPNWLYNFRHLELLDLSFNFLKGEISNAIGNMNSLATLDLLDNEFDRGNLKLFKNLCNLRALSLEGVNLSQDVSDILEIQSSCVSNELQSMDLHGCNLFGQLSNHLGNFNKLTSLDLSKNSISGPIPLSLVELMSLRVLRLQHNKLSGIVPEGLGTLANLNEIGISYNLLEGNISENHFANLSKLIFFDGSMNGLILRVSSDWIPPFIHLEFLSLRGWDVGLQFLSWIGSLKNLYHLDLSNSRISKSIPNWFWNSSSSYFHLNLSHNQIHGAIPDISLSFDDVAVIDLSSNLFKGSLPRISTNVTFIDFSNNSFSGSLSHFLCHETDDEEKYSMVFMHLSKNFLSGEIPDCWSNWTSLESISLSHNNFSGNIPESIGDLTFLRLLHLQNNSLSGEVPSSLQNCTILALLDLGENRLTGHISAWIGKSLSSMSILILRGNKLDGNIPKEICQLKYLHILDLSHNFLSGNIPNCIGNFSSMATTDPHDQFYVSSASFGDIELSSREDTMIMMKGQMLEYETLLKFVRSMDLSSNKLSGKIPREITVLTGLQSLNLSNNFLSEKIPEHMGVMSEVEVLDFSQNQLYGRIPQSITNLTFLSILNLSYNKLSGRIPTGTQLQTLNPSSFVGNEGLCGPPLSDNCSANGVVTNAENGNGDGDEVDWILYVSIELGFIVAFWSILCPLFINRRWRHTYYDFLDRLWNRVWRSFNCL